MFTKIDVLTETKQNKRSKNLLSKQNKVKLKTD